MTNDEMPTWAKTLLDKVNALENNLAGSNAPQIVELNNVKDEWHVWREASLQFNFSWAWIRYGAQRLFYIGRFTDARREQCNLPFIQLGEIQLSNN